LITIDKIHPKGLWATEIALIFMLGLCCISWEYYRCRKDKHRGIKNDGDEYNIEGGLFTFAPSISNSAVRRRSTVNSGHGDALDGSALVNRS
jgi:hypothetical protein